MNHSSCKFLDNHTLTKTCRNIYEDFGIFQKEIKELKAAGLLDFEEGRVECLNPELDVGEQADLLPYNRDKWEFPRDKLKLGNILTALPFLSLGDSFP